MRRDGSVLADEAQALAAARDFLQPDFLLQRHAAAREAASERVEQALHLPLGGRAPAGGQPHRSAGEIAARPVGGEPRGHRPVAVIGVGAVGHGGVVGEERARTFARIVAGVLKERADRVGAYLANGVVVAAVVLLPAEVLLRFPVSHGAGHQFERARGGGGIGREFVGLIPFALVGGEAGATCGGHGFGERAIAVARVRVGGHAAFGVAEELREPTVVHAPERRVIRRLLREELHPPHHAIHARRVAVMIGQTLVVKARRAHDREIHRAEPMPQHPFEKEIVRRAAQQRLGGRAVALGTRIERGQRGVEEALETGAGKHFQPALAEHTQALVGGRPEARAVADGLHEKRTAPLPRDDGERAFLAAQAAALEPDLMLARRQIADAQRELARVKFAARHGGECDRAERNRLGARSRICRRASEFTPQRNIPAREALRSKRREHRLLLAGEHGALTMRGEKKFGREHKRGSRGRRGGSGSFQHEAVGGEFDIAREIGRVGINLAVGQQPEIAERARVGQPDREPRDERAEGRVLAEQQFVSPAQLQSHRPRGARGIQRREPHRRAADAHAARIHAQRRMIRHERSGLEAEDEVSRREHVAAGFEHLAALRRIHREIVLQLLMEHLPRRDEVIAAKSKTHRRGLGRDLSGNRAPEEIRPQPPLRLSCIHQRKHRAALGLGRDEIEQVVLGFLRCRRVRFLGRRRRFPSLSRHQIAAAERICNHDRGEPNEAEKT